MATRWNVARAKASLSELLRAAADSPQEIENRGRPVAVVLGIDEYRVLSERAARTDEGAAHARIPRRERRAPPAGGRGARAASAHDEDVPLRPTAQATPCAAHGRAVSYVVDTNVVSELARPTPNRGVVHWFGTQATIALSSISIEELAYGIARARVSERRRLTPWFEALLAIPAEMLGRGRASRASRRRAPRRARASRAHRRSGRHADRSHRDRLGPHARHAQHARLRGMRRGHLRSVRVTSNLGRLSAAARVRPTTSRRSARTSGRRGDRAWACREDRRQRSPPRTRRTTGASPRCRSSSRTRGR